jgi:hypothetical protein
MAFCSTVGQAIFQTALPIGPSTIDRSSFFLPGLEGGSGVATPGVMSAGDPVAASATDAGRMGFGSPDKEKS